MCIFSLLSAVGRSLFLTLMLVLAPNFIVGSHNSQPPYRTEKTVQPGVLETTYR
jgi:hypothetical protein